MTPPHHHYTPHASSRSISNSLSSLTSSHTSNSTLSFRSVVDYDNDDESGPHHHEEEGHNNNLLPRDATRGLIERFPEATADAAGTDDDEEEEEAQPPPPAHLLFGFAVEEEEDRGAVPAPRISPALATGPPLPQPPSPQQQPAVAAARGPCARVRLFSNGSTDVRPVPCCGDGADSFRTACECSEGMRQRQLKRQWRVSNRHDSSSTTTTTTATTSPPRVSVCADQLWLWAGGGGGAGGSGGGSAADACERCFTLYSRGSRREVWRSDWLADAGPVRAARIHAVFS